MTVIHDKYCLESYFYCLSLVSTRCKQSWWQSSTVTGVLFYCSAINEELERRHKMFSDKRK